MSDGFPDRLTQLRARWQGDPSSRVFLQLAEEYRHLGRVQEALEVLQRGLKEHPGYLSALVAKGRCLLELGDAAEARTVLERVVQQDATQMVANKLLVRACLETGEADRARERLDIYSLLNDSDPEIEELRRRVVAMSRPPQAADEPPPEETAEESPMNGTDLPAGPPPGRPSAAHSSDVFDLVPSEAVHAFAVEGNVFDLAPPPPAPPPAESSAALRPFGAQAAPSPLAGSALPPRGHGHRDEPFPDLAPEESLRTYLAGLEAERIFTFAAAPPLLDAAAVPVAPPPVAAPVPVPLEPIEDWPAPAVPAAASAPQAVPPAEAAAVEVETLAPAELEAPAAADFELPAPLDFAPSAPAGFEAAPAAAAPVVVPDASADEAGATATLGELYLRQGHLGEAERIFRTVLRREPRNAAASRALDEIERRRQPLLAAALLADESDPSAPLAARKAHLLRGYLTRLRQAGRPHVP